MNTTTASARQRALQQWRIPLVLVVFALASCVVLLLPLFGTETISLSDVKRIGEGMPVHTRGVVTFVSKEGRFYYLQDDTAGMRVYPSEADPLPLVGEPVAIRAKVKEAYDAGTGRKSVTLSDIQMKRAGQIALPKAEAKTVEDLHAKSGVREAIRVETSGTVRAARHEDGKLLLEIGENGLRLPLVVMDAGVLTRDSLLDTRIRVRGVVSVEYNPWEQSVARNDDPGPLLQIASHEDLDLLERAPTKIPLAPSVRALITEPQWVGLGHRVRIHGVVVKAASPHVLLIENGELVMPVETPRARDYKPGETIEAVGWPTPRRFTITLQRADVRLIAPATLQLGPGEAQSGLPTMTSIAAIRELPDELASRAYPVSVQAVLTAVHHQRDRLFIQVGDRGIDVDASDQLLEQLRPGQRVHLRGVTWWGGFAPVIVHPQLALLGEGELPRAQPVEPQMAASGAYDSEWVEIEGLVRPIKEHDTGYVFNMMTPVGSVEALMINASDGLELESLVDARVRVQGVFAMSFTNDRVLTGYRIFIDSPASMQIVRASPGDAASLAVKPIDDLLRFAGDAQDARRARVRGTVTLRTTDMLYIEDKSGSLRIQTSGQGLRIGETLDAIGYPSPSDNGPILFDATLRRTAETREIAPPLVTPEQVLSGDLDNRLVTMEARLLNKVSSTVQQTLVLHDGHTTFNAHLNEGASLDALREGSVLRVTGIVAVQRQRPLYRDFTSHPVSFRLMIRSGNDVQVVQAAPWWNLRHAWPALAVLTLSIALAMLWVAALRRRVRAQTAEIDAQRAFLRQVIDMCPNYIFVKDRAGRFTLVNRALAAAHGYQPHDMVGKTDLDIGMTEAEASAYHRDDLEVVDSKLEKVVREEPHTDGEGRQLWMHTVKRPLLDEQGFATHVLGVSNDVTLHKDAETVLQKAREAAEAANQAKSEFLANMSHEIRTPLNGILGMSELCLGTQLSRDQYEYIETVKLSADGLLNVINDILDFSKIEAGKLALDPAPFDIRESLDATLKTVALRAHQKGLELLCEVDADVPDTAVGDANRLRQVLLNLVGNAVKFTERGEVVLRACVESTAGTAQVDAQTVLRFTVSDSGIGIAPDRQTLIFNPFVQADTSTTRQYGGTGLGLTISNRLVTMMGGRIWVESELGKGSKFHFTIRLGQAVARQRDAAPVHRTLRGVSVLIVDDNQTSRRILHEALLRWEMHPLLAESAEHAIELLERYAGTESPVQLVLTDLNMPEGDGLALVEEMRKRPAIAASVIMMLISSGQREDAARWRSLGVTNFLMKPIRVNELREAMIQALSSCEAVATQMPRTLRPARIGSELNILVAEDNPVNQLVMQRLLAKRGHRVTIAATGSAAIAEVEQQTFDLVFMDVQMPVVDGFEATREIRRREAGGARRVPIVALTAHAMSGDRERCLGSGMDGYMTKPVNPRELDQTLKIFGGSADNDTSRTSAASNRAV